MSFQTHHVPHIIVKGFDSDTVPKIGAAKVEVLSKIKRGGARERELK
jgi:hypothetical protein